jgi:hypothetical protein
LTGSSTSNTISVTVGPESSGGAIKVKGVNSCGEGKESSLALVINNLPSPAGMISGKANVLKGAAEIYTVPEIPGAQSYIWTLPNGMTGTGNINSISILVGEEAVSGNIKVRGHNDCGDGAENALALSVNEIPATAGLISGKSMVCKGTVVSYSVPVIPGAESYIWSLPTGFKGSSSSLTITVSIESNAVNGEIKVKGSNSSGEGQESSLQVSIKELPSQLDLISGNPTVCKGTSEIYSVPVNQNSDTYIWTLPPGTSGSSAVNSVSAFFGPDAVSGIVSVKGQNICGEGPIRSLPVNINSGPAAATEIIGKMEICKGGSEIYSVQPILGADSYVWTLPSGMTGSSSSNSIAISTSAGTGSGTLIVKGINACGAGLEKSLFISVKELPVSLGPITGKDMVCKGTSEIYSVPALTNADTYSWSLPGGFSGNSLSNHLTALVGTNAIQGIIKVKAQNSCGEGPESTLGVKVNQSPSEAGTITGNSIICLEESELYSVPEITGADAYSWTLPSGLYGSSDSNSIMITAGNSVVSGNIQVSGKNTCGEGLAASRAVNVITGVVPQIASKWNDILICYNLENKIQSYRKAGK